MLQAPATCCFFQASSALFIRNFLLRRRLRQYRNKKYSPMIARVPKTDDTTMVPINIFLLKSRLRRSCGECGDIVEVVLTNIMSKASMTLWHTYRRRLSPVDGNNKHESVKEKDWPTRDRQRYKIDILSLTWLRTNCVITVAGNVLKIQGIILVHRSDHYT